MTNLQSYVILISDQGYTPYMNEVTKMKEIKSPTLYDIVEAFTNYNKKHGITYGTRRDVPEISAVIVYKQSNWNQVFSEKSRSYRITNLSGKRFFDGMIGNSIIGDCLDGTDLNVRLDYYNWKIERCYFE